MTAPLLLTHDGRWTTDADAAWYSLHYDIAARVARQWGGPALAQVRPERLRRIGETIYYVERIP